MEAKLEIKYSVDDPSFIQVYASNGLFAGYTEEYMNIKSLMQLGAELEGFPNSLDSKIKFSTYKNESGVSLEFSCKDLTGHCCVKVNLLGKAYSKVTNDSAVINLSFEGAALDTFVQGLKAISNITNGTLTLEGVKNA